MKRVYALYRVSTKRQVDKDKDSNENDIPMQKQACHRFAEQNGWVIVKEFLEKGVSGFKVSADDRDAIQDLKAAAERKEFDILLVFMFDRLGRRQNETPFVVEWFAAQGIEIWSTQEGQQRFENDVDYLMNYMRYWKSNSESKSTSTRVKTRMRQLTAEGVYTGGVTPYGYKLVRSGKFNKRGKELMDIQIDETEAAVVRLIFNRTVKEGYGSYRMADYLNERGIKTHNGSKFQCNTINRILRNRMYCGYFISGDIVSPLLEHLQIIDENHFMQAQYILDQRSYKEQEKQQIARNTKGKTLLSGNLYCAHCGSKMIATSYVDSHTRADGTEYRVRRQRYICCNKAQKRGKCDGQAAYVAATVDEAVLEILREYFSRIRVTPRDKALERRYKQDIIATQAQQKKLSEDTEKMKRRLVELSGEIAKSLMGESVFTPDILSQAIEATKEEIRQNEQQLQEVSNSLDDREGAMQQLDYYYAQFRSWADEFDNATNEQKKMIACQLLREVRVSRGYELDIVFNINYEQFLLSTAANMATAG